MNLKDFNEICAAPAKIMSVNTIHVFFYTKCTSEMMVWSYQQLFGFIILLLL